MRGLNMLQKHLRRQNGIVAGVCGGIGTFLGINPWWFRGIFIFLAMPGGLPGILPYILLWIMIPRPSEFDMTTDN
jgi:phage shock protein C